MLEYAKVCQSMLEYARGYQSMPEYARVRQSMPEYAIVCQSMTEYARVCQSVPEHARVLPSFAFILHYIDILIYIDKSFDQLGLSYWFESSILFEHSPQLMCELRESKS